MTDTVTFIIERKEGACMNLENMMQDNPQTLVTSYNGVLVANSLEVADRFGKAHKNVIQSIESLITQLSSQSARNSADYFIPDNYMDRRNRVQKRYKMTRDGFSLLVMGFTGPAALHWKCLYIEAFNKMEAALQNQTDLKQLISMITKDVICQVLPELKEAVKPTATSLEETRERSNRRLYTLYGNEDALPNFLTVYDVRDFLGIGQRQAYEMVRSEGFPKKAIGNSYRIPKKEFLDWLHRQ